MDTIVTSGTIMDFEDIPPTGQEENETLTEKARSFWCLKFVTISPLLFNLLLWPDSEIPEKYEPYHLKFITKGKGLNRGERIRSLTYEYDVKPTLPWKRIKGKLTKTGMAEDEIDALIMVLKPSLLAEELSGFPEVRVLVETTSKRINHSIRNLSPLLKQLQNLQHDESFKDFLPLSQTIGRIQYKIALDREIIKTGRDIYKRYCKMWGFDKNLKKSPQKHKFWNAVVSAGLLLINKYYHTERCGDKCSRTHEGAIRKIAELLKILYPEIWKENILTVTSRIKQKNYRSL